jgi:3-oxoacyl-[acyl-carrier protein] reductase
MDLGLKDRVVLVGAASQGIGRAIALGFAREGAKVAICGRDTERLAAARKAIEAESIHQVLAVRADVTNPADVERLVAEVTQRWETIHVLVNNAGGPPPGRFDALTDADWTNATTLTLMSAVRMTRAALPYMRHQNWGRVVNISSFSVKQPIDELTLSNSIRLSVLGWAKSLANEVASEGVLVNTVCPGWTRTDRVDAILAGRAKSESRTSADVEQDIARRIPMRRFGSPDEIAVLAVFLASARASYITGTAIQVDGGITQAYY